MWQTRPFRLAPPRPAQNATSHCFTAPSKPAVASRFSPTHTNDDTPPLCAFFVDNTIAGFSSEKMRTDSSSEAEARCVPAGLKARA
jgi:hypothetical protein